MKIFDLAIPVPEVSDVKSLIATAASVSSELGAKATQAAQDFAQNRVSDDRMAVAIAEYEMTAGFVNKATLKWMASKAHREAIKLDLGWWESEFDDKVEIAKAVMAPSYYQFTGRRPSIKNEGRIDALLERKS